MKTFWIVMATVVAWIVFFGSILIGTPAWPSTLRGDTDGCTALMSSVLDASKLRDEGMPWDLAKVQLDGAIERAMGKDGSIVQDADDAVLIRHVFREMWTGEQEALDATLKAYETCMAPSI